MIDNFLTLVFQFFVKSHTKLGSKKNLLVNYCCTNESPKGCCEKKLPLQFWR